MPTPTLLAALHGRWRVATRLVMILLSARGFHAAQVAQLLGYHPRTVRRWIRRYQQHGIGGLAGRPRCGPAPAGQPQAGPAHPPAAGQPTAWTIPRLWQRLGRPAISQRTLHRRVREVASSRRPRLVARGDPDRDQILATLRQAIAQLPAGSVVLAEDETHLNLLAWVRATWIARDARQQVMTPGTNRRRSVFGPSILPVAASCTGWPARRSAPRSSRSASSCWPPTGHAAGGGGLRQRDHPPLQAGAALAGRPSPGSWCCTGRATAHDNPTERVWGALKAWLANNPP